MKTTFDALRAPGALYGSNPDLEGAGHLVVDDDKTIEAIDWLRARRCRITRIKVHDVKSAERTILVRYVRTPTTHEVAVRRALDLVHDAAEKEGA